MSDIDEELLELYLVAQAAYDRAVEATTIDTRSAMTPTQSLAAWTAAGTRRRADLPRRPPTRRNAMRKSTTSDSSSAAKAVMRDATLLAESDFHGTATIQSEEDALPFAQMVCTTCPTDVQQLVYWIDVSCNDQQASSSWSVAVESSGSGSGRVDRHVSQGSEHSEMMAIRTALQMAVEEMLERQQTKLELPTLVRVFSDSQTALRKICRARHPAIGDPMPAHPDVAETIKGILHCSEMLKDLGARQELHWVPRGKMDGSRIAETMSRNGTTSPEGSIEQRCNASGASEALPCVASSSALAPRQSHARYVAASLSC